MTATETVNAMGPATQFRPGSRGKLAVLIERQSLSQELFNPLDAGWEGAGDDVEIEDTDATLEGDDCDVCDVSRFDRQYDSLLDDFLRYRMRQVRARRNREVSVAPCLTSRDKSKPGCTGGCSWCSLIQECDDGETEVEATNVGEIDWTAASGCDTDESVTVPRTKRHRKAGLPRLKAR